MIRIERNPPRLPSPKRALRSPLLRQRYRALPPELLPAPAEPRANLPLVRATPRRALPLRASARVALGDRLPRSLPSPRPRGLP